MMINAVVTLGVVMVGLAVHDKFVRPKMMQSNDSTPSPAPAPAPAPVMDEEA